MVLIPTTQFNTLQGKFNGRMIEQKMWRKRHAFYMFQNPLFYTNIILQLKTFGTFVYS